ncbi:MAG: SDR family oxidoreductase [Bacteroidota bacterium]
MKTILVTGANGLLGQKIVYALAEREDVRCISTGIGPNRMKSKSGYQYEELDIRDVRNVELLLEKYRPDAIINTAALTNVDACEQRREEAIELNVHAPRVLATAAKRVESHFVHLSTDFVFNGEAGPYVETDEPDPLSHYAQTKLDGEQAVITACDSWAIIRTIIIYGVVDDNSRSNVVLWALNNLRAGKPINVINDQFRSPTLAEDLAEACIEAALRRSQGIFHCSGRETMCILDMVRIVVDYFGLDHSLVKPVSSAELNQPAKRPPVTGFIISKAERELDFRPRNFLEGLTIVKNQLISNGVVL